MSERKWLTPGYAGKSFASARTGRLTLLTSKDGRNGSIPLNQDADLFLPRLNAGDEVAHPLRLGRHAWVQVAEGEVTVKGHPITTGDGASLSEESVVEITGRAPAQVLLFDLT